MIKFLKKIKDKIISIKTQLIFAGIGALLLISGALVVYGGYMRLKNIQDELGRSRNNEMAYMDIINKDLEKNRRALELTRYDLNNSNDKMVRSIEEVRKSLKTPKNKPGDVSVAVNTIMDDSIKILVPPSLKIDTIVMPNEFTKFTIKFDGDSLKVSFKINNTQYLYVYSKREYLNRYNNGLVRFFHFDWKKIETTRYDIVNTNKLITVDSIRVIKVRE